MSLFSLVRRLRLLMLAALSAMLLIPTPPTYAAGYSLKKVVGGLSAPDAIVQGPNDPARLFVVDLAGVIRLVKNQQLVTQSFLDLTSVVTTAIYGQGLFNLAFDPDYARNGLLHVLYAGVTMNIDAFGQGNDGAIYVADIKTNAIYVLSRA